MKTHVGQVFPKIICDSFEHQVPTEPVPVEGKDGIQNGSRALWVLVAVSRQLLAGLQVEIEGRPIQPPLQVSDSHLHYSRLNSFHLDRGPFLFHQLPSMLVFSFFF